MTRLDPPGWMRRCSEACLRILAIGLLAASLIHIIPPPAQAKNLSPEIAQLYSSVSILPPTPQGMTVCYGFVCRRRAALDFSAADRAALTRIVRAGQSSPAAERKALQQAVIWFDRKVGPSLGTNKRVSHADFRHRADHQNFDCWDTTRNVTSLLLVLQDWGALRHHTVGAPRYRGNALKLQTPHNTAVVVERQTGREWVVDMWTRAYAEPPDVMSVEQWESEK